MNFLNKLYQATGLLVAREEFDAHVLQFNLNFATPAERDFRFDLWHEVDQVIKEHNAIEDKSFTLAHNHFSTLSADEKEKYSIKPRSKTAKASVLSNWVYKDEVTAKPIDWRARGIETPVRDLAQCDDPYAVAAVEEMSMAHSIRSGRSDVEELSIQQMIDCYDSGSSCGGRPGENPYLYIQKQGLTCAQEYPLTGKKGQCRFDLTMRAITVEKVVYLDQTKETPIAPTALEDALAIEPVTVLVDNSGFQFMAYAAGIIDSADCGENATFPMVAVGWGIENGKQYYILKNTWGENWGEKGYARIAATESGWGVCGVQSMGEYPITN